MQVEILRTSGREPGIQIKSDGHGLRQPDLPGTKVEQGQRLPTFLREWCVESVGAIRAGAETRLAIRRPATDMPFGTGRYAFFSESSK